MNNNHTFLQSIANYYYQLLKTDSSSICFVFPSQRAGIFFIDYLKKLSDQPLFAPKIITINDLFAKQSRMITADNITLLFQLHQTYSRIIGDNRSFDEFMPWGEMILSDFEDIDKYMVEAGQLFRNLADYKQLDDDYSHLSEAQRKAIASFWGTFHLQKLSEHQQSFINTWEKLHEVYTAFRSELKQQGIAYAGMIYREVAEQIQTLKTFDNKETRYAFVGFNALTTSEHIVFKFLQKQNRAQFFWDYSEQILPSARTGPITRGAGMFLNENVLQYPKPKDWEMPLNAHTPEVTITAVAHPMEQNAEITEFLKREYTNDERSAVVLTDENMLLPVLYALPDEVSRVNVTMGYPLKSSPAYGLVDLLYQLQKNCRADKRETWFYYRNVLPLLQHPYISMAVGTSASDIKNEMVKNNQVFIPASMLKAHPLLGIIFEKVTGSNKLSPYMIGIIGSLFESFSQNPDYTFQREFIFSLYTALNRFDEILRKNSHLELETETWFRLFRGIAEIQTVSFKGEPLAGLQVMGILETRAIDFDKLIILDMNEGVFPKTSATNTFIPYGLRVGFGLPTIEFQDSIFAYYFFRLIHRAKKVELLYSASANGEMSRFLFQLIYEFKIDPTLKTSVQPVNLLKSPPLRVKKDKTVLQKLEKYSASGSAFLSPSAISQYIECPMRFYYEKIAGIKETEEVTEEADARIFGKIFHEVLENYYKPLKNKTISSETIDSWLADTARIEDNIRKAFETQLGNQAGQQIQGKNILIFEVIRSYIIQFFNKEKEIAPFVFVDAERQVVQTFTTPAGIEIKLGGFIDRLHRKDGALHIIDYKTGSGKSDVANIEDLFDAKKHKDNKAIFQTLLYGLLINPADDGAQSVQPGISWMKNLFKTDYNTNVYIKQPRGEASLVEYRAIQDEFMGELGRLIDTLYDAGNDFCQTNNDKACSYCTFKELCNR